MNLIEHIDGMVPFPEGVYRKDTKADDVTIHTRIGVQGPAVVMLHGFGTTGDMWAPVASALVDTHTVIVPDLLGIRCVFMVRSGLKPKLSWFCYLR